ncbi:MAG: type II toxin-antitoxin system RelE/ParE family toxin [Defluviitaleaceae bacterium]|nr:type II toxin-antitoxin system RelE/ParE family toxin [Defluviitaleaceae bacterium]
MRVVKSKQVRKYIDSQDKLTRKRLDDALNELPFGDVVPIVSIPNTFRLRIGKFRALFVKEANIIKVTLIESRGQAYK